LTLERFRDVRLEYIPLPSFPRRR